MPDSPTTAAVTAKPSAEVSKMAPDQLWSNPKALTFIREAYGPKLSQMEWNLFMAIGKTTGLNPFLREIYAVKYGTAPASIFIGRDGYRKSAQASKHYDYHYSDSIYEKDVFKVVKGEVVHEYGIGVRGKLVGAYAVCKRKGSSLPNFKTVQFKEYNTGKSTWAGKPDTMIQKVAEAQVLRQTFQELFAGTYAEEERDAMKEVAGTEVAVDTKATEKSAQNKKAAEKMLEGETAPVEKKEKPPVEPVK